MSLRPDGLDALLAPLDDNRRAEILALDGAIRSLAPGLEPLVANGMINYGSCRYRYASGRSGETASLAVAPRATGISVYVGFAPVERWAHRLPRADCGKGCIRLKHAADLEFGVLAEIVAHAQRIDGRYLDWTGLPHGADPRVS